MRGAALVLVCLAAVAPAARAGDARTSLREQVAAAITALDEGDAARAVTLLEKVARDPEAEATVQYDLGVAFSRAERRDEARAAYRGALAAAGKGEHEERVRGAALYNLGTSHLSDAHAASEVLRDPARVAQTVQGSTPPGGGPMSPEGRADLERAIRATTARKGLSHARDAISALRDRVRNSPSDRDAAHNLQVAQRVRRFLQEELEKHEQSEPEQSGKDGDDSGEDDGEQSDPSGSDEQSGDDSSQENPSGGEQGEQDQEQPESDGAEGEQDQTEGDEAQPSGGQDGESDSGDEKPPEPQGAAGQGDEKKNEPLADMLEAAARRLRLVEEMRRSKMRQVKVEKDW